MTVGTGIGTAVVEDGRPLTRGRVGGGVLGGQIPIAPPDPAPDAPRDTSGRTGTIEALCAARRIVDYANAAGGTYAATPDVYAGFRRGEPAARAGIARYRGALLRGIVALAHAHAPDVIVVGGGPMVEGNPITDGLEEELESNLWSGYEADVRLAVLGDAAALAGLTRLFG
jgi:predicted NBD/HSP70 family sugar kinase